VSTIVTLLTSVTALIGGFWVLSALFGPIRGRPERGRLMIRVQQALTGLSLLVIALFVAAPVGFFGAWFFVLIPAAVVALIRPDWMVRGRSPGRLTAALIYIGLASVAVILAITVEQILESGNATMGHGHGHGAGSTSVDAWLVDIATLATLLGARNWIWFWRKNAPFAKKPELDAPQDATAGDGAWWDRAWARQATAETGFSDTDAGAQGADDHPLNDGAAPDSVGKPPGDADAALRVPGYDPALLAEELAAFRAHIRAIDRVAVTWPDHPVAEALIHVSAILNETRRYLQDHPHKYRDLRPILVGHATTAADIATLVQRIKGTGETLDDADGVARRLFALGSLMRETRRKSTQAERDRLKASMAVIDQELNALSAVRDIRERMARNSDPV